MILTLRLSLSIAQMCVTNIYFIYLYQSEQTQLSLFLTGLIICFILVSWHVYFLRQINMENEIKTMINSTLMIFSQIILTEIVTANVKVYDSSAVIIVTTQYLYVFIELQQEMKKAQEFNRYAAALIALLFYGNIRLSLNQIVSNNLYFALAFTLLLCLRLMIPTPQQTKKNVQKDLTTHVAFQEVPKLEVEAQPQDFLQKIELSQLIPEKLPQLELKRIQSYDASHELAQSIAFQSQNKIIHQPQVFGQEIRGSKMNLLNLIPEGIILLTARDLQVQFINKAAQKLFKIDSPQQFLAEIELLENIEFWDNQKHENQSQSNQTGSLSTYTSFSHDLRSSLVHRTWNKNQLNRSIVMKKSISVQQEFRELNDSKQEDCKNQTTNIILKALFKIQEQYKKFQPRQEAEFYGTFLAKLQIQQSVSLSMIESQIREKKSRKIELSLFALALEEEKAILIQVRDITHRDYIKLLRQHSKEKSNLISFVSHEFRSPLNNMILLLNVAQEQFKDQLDKALLQHLQIVTNNCEYLLGLSNDLLDLALIKVQKFKMNIKQFDLYALVGQCLQLFEIEASNRKVELIQEIGRHVPKYISSDPNRIRQILMNLLSNAFKFTSKGCIIVRLERIDKLIKIEVQDSGLGIKLEDQPKLMTAFGKLNNGESGKLNEQGVGLGLLISNMIAKNLNLANVGNQNSEGLQFSSEFLVGTNFWFFVSDQTQDLAKVQDPQILEVSQESDEDNYYKVNDESPQQINIDHRTTIAKKLQDKIYFRNRSGVNSGEMLINDECQCSQILIVDDIQFNIDILKMLILKQNPKLKINSTISGIYAEIMIKKQLEYACPVSCKGYQLIFMDIEMPIQDGYKTARQIQSIYASAQKSIVIVGQSAYQGDIEKKKALFHGMDEFLTKPIQKSDINTLLHKYL